jgi:hypothetical protein
VARLTKILIHFVDRQAEVGRGASQGSASGALWLPWMKHSAGLERSSSKMERHSIYCYCTLELV